MERGFVLLFVIIFGFFSATLIDLAFKNKNARENEGLPPRVQDNDGEIELPSRVFSFVFDIYESMNAEMYLESVSAFAHIFWNGERLLARKGRTGCDLRGAVFTCYAHVLEGPHPLLAISTWNGSLVTLTHNRVVLYKDHDALAHSILVPPLFPPPKQLEKSGDHNRQFCVTAQGFAFVAQANRIFVFELATSELIESLVFPQDRQVWDVKSDRTGSRLYALVFLFNKPSIVSFIFSIYSKASIVLEQDALLEAKFEGILNRPNALVVFDSFLVAVDDRTLVLFTNSLEYIRSVRLGSKYQAWRVLSAIPFFPPNATQLILSLSETNQFGSSLLSYDLARFL